MMKLLMRDRVIHTLQLSDPNLFEMVIASCPRVLVFLLFALSVPHHVSDHVPIITNTKQIDIAPLLPAKFNAYADNSGVYSIIPPVAPEACHGSQSAYQTAKVSHRAAIDQSRSINHKQHITTSKRIRCSAGCICFLV